MINICKVQVLTPQTFLGCHHPVQDKERKQKDLKCELRPMRRVHGV